MQLGQVITRIEYKTETFLEECSFDNSITLDDYLNNQAKDGWLLHTIRVIEYNEYRTYYHCIWQKFINVQQGIIQ